jgi:hypothetical protein
MEELMYEEWKDKAEVHVEHSIVVTVQVTSEQNSVS